MFTAATQYRYVSELVWLPTYVAVCALTTALIDNSWVATLVTLFALIASRIVLEVLYRIAFGDSRLQLRVGILAFMSQVGAWGLLLVWFSRHGGA